MADKLTVTQALELCPFCAGPAKLVRPMGDWVGKGHGVDGGYYGPSRYQYVCGNLYDNPSRPCPGRNGGNSEAEAVTAWNTRHRAQQTARSGDVGREAYVEVPREPTDEMIKHAVYNTNRKYNHNPVDSTIAREVYTAAVWARPIAALTTPPASDDGGLEEHFPSGLRAEYPRTACGVPAPDTGVSVDCYCGWSTNAADEQEARQLWAIHARQALSATPANHEPLDGGAK